MVILIDNYDSFTYNIYQAIGMLGFEVRVMRNDKTSLAEIESLNPSHIIIGPGPKSPKEAGISLEVIHMFKGKIPILGICLGHQAILHAFGVEIKNAKNIVHGKLEPLLHNAKGLFSNITPRINIVRYHSLVGKKEEIPDCFLISAMSEDGEVMAVEHKEFELMGVQFHPESIGTQEGLKILQNFFRYVREPIIIQNFINQAMNGEDFSFDSARDFMYELTQGAVSEAHIASFLTSLNIKGVNEFELAGFASVLRDRAMKVSLDSRYPISFDIVGTGGSAFKTFNVSTTTMLLLSSFAKAHNFGILKHGNRAVTSKSGSADVLSELGINIDMSPQAINRSYSELGIAFLFAQKHHSALRYAAPVRKALGFKTAFNLIGPLSNPCLASHYLIGVFDPKYTEVLARALKILGAKRALVVSGVDGYDEISLTSPTQITSLINEKIETRIFTPSEVGLEYAKQEDLIGGDSTQNANIALEIFHAKPSAKLDLVALNMGAALFVCEQVQDLKEGVHLAREIIESRLALATLEQFRIITNA